MPTVLLVRGWRIFFYANEGDEPIHVHAEKGGMECKYWLDREEFEIEEEFSYGMDQSDRRDIRAILFRNFEQIEAEWDAFQRRKGDATGA